jgi:hypothetical protein
VSVANLWLFGDRLPDIHKRRLGAAARTTRDDRLGGCQDGGHMAADGGGHALRLTRPNLKRSSKVKELKKRAECSSEETKGERRGGVEDLLHPFSALPAGVVTGEATRRHHSLTGRTERGDERKVETHSIRS